MKRILMLVAAFAVIIAFGGSMSHYLLGDGASAVFAGGHGGGGDPGGGDPAGGDPTGGDPTGGDPTGGDPTGGDPTGGDPTGGNPGGGPPTGGDSTSGDPTGGKQDFDPSQPPDGFTGFADLGDGVVQYFGDGDFSPSVEHFFTAGHQGRVEFNFEDFKGQGDSARLDPSAFSQDFFTLTFDPSQIEGDFGELFSRDDFVPGQLGTLFDPSLHTPEDFGSLFTTETFNPGDFGDFAAIGDRFKDLGEHFKTFFGERGDDALAAENFFQGVSNVGDFDPSEIFGQLEKLDFQGYDEVGKDLLSDLFAGRDSADEIDLRGDQWAGVFTNFAAADILVLHPEFARDAVHELKPEDFLVIPDDNTFALFEQSFFDGEIPEDIDVDDFAGKLEEFKGQLPGFLGGLNEEHRSQVGQDQLAGMVGKIDFGATDFDPTVLAGRLDKIVAEFGGDQVADLIAEQASKFQDLIATLDFGENSDLLAEFSLNAIDTITGGDLPDIDLSEFDPAKVANLVNSIGGGEIFTLASKQLEEIVLTSDPISIKLFDADVVGGIFAGLDIGQITGFDQDILQSALEAAQANLLGGLGDFESIAGQDTAFAEFFDLPVAEAGDIVWVDVAGSTLTDNAVALITIPLFPKRET